MTTPRDWAAARSFGFAIVLAACSAVPWTMPNATFLVNACTRDSDCAAYGYGALCNVYDHACTNNTHSNYTLVVSLPETAAAFPPGTTYMFVEACSGGTCGNACDAGLCETLPPAVQVEAQYAVLPSAFGVSDLGNGGAAVAIPSTAVFRALTSPPTSIEATVAGLPIPPVAAQVTVADPSVDTINPWGPNGTDPERFVIIAPEDRPENLFELTITPDPPFDTVFPPNIQVVSFETTALLEQAPSEPERASLNAAGPPVFDFSGSQGVDLSGFTVTLRDATTHRPISPAVTLPSHPPLPKVALPTNHHADGGAFVNAELAVLPPAGSTTPTWVIPPQSGNAPLPSAPTYPRLPPPTTVAGTVASASSLVFTSTTLFDADAGTQANLSYSVQVETARTPLDGGYAFYASLPIGKYSVRIAPDDPAWAITPVALSVQVDGAVFTSLDLAPRSIVLGKAIVAAGHPLVGATIVLSPSLRATLPLPPRGATTVTDAYGAFSLPADPGNYDLRVEPALGSHLPWVVLPDVTVAQEGALSTFADVVVPVPTDSSFTLLSSTGAVVPFAVVRAYAPLDGGVPLFTEIGESITDAYGHLSLYLAPNL